MKVIAIANPKGGVGKTATTLALAEGLSKAYQALLLDLDPQATLTEVCGIYEYKTPCIGDVFQKGENDRVSIQDTILPFAANIDLIPADLSLLSAMMDLVQQEDKEYLLKNTLRSIKHTYDICLIDCPPSLGLLTANAIVAADGVLIPAQPEKTDSRGLVEFLDSIERTRQVFNKNLQVLGIFLTFFNERFSHHQDSLQHFQEINLPLLPVHVGSSVKVPEAMAIRHSILSYAPNHRVSENYKKLVEIVGHWVIKERER